MTESESRTPVELGQWTETGTVGCNRRTCEERMSLRKHLPGVVRGQPHRAGVMLPEKQGRVRHRYLLVSTSISISCADVLL